MSSSTEKDSERFRWVGEQFSSSCEKFMGNLGYKIISIGKDHKDAIIEGPPTKIPFGPRNKCIVEITTSNIKDGEITEMKEKMIRSGIDEGLWITNSKTADNVIKKAKEKGIFIWDVRALSFIAAIQNILGLWCTGTIVQKKIDEKLYFIRSLERPKKEDIFINALIFFIEQTEDFMIRDLEKAVEFLLADISEAGFGSIEINLIILSLGLVNKATYSELEKTVGKINKKFEDKTIYINQKEMPVAIIDFFTSPADYLLLFS